MNITLNGHQCEVEGGQTIFQAAAKHGIHIPTFCYDERLVAHGACRI